MHAELGQTVHVAVEPETRTSHPLGNGLWPWAFSTGGILFLVGGMLHPRSDSSLPEAQATAQSLGAATWIPSHAFILASAIAFFIGLLGLARSHMRFATPPRRAAWVAAGGALFFAVEGVFHLGAFADQDAVLAGEDTTFLSTHMTLSLVVYPLFSVAVAALAVLSGRVVTHPGVSVIAVIGAAAFGTAPALVGLAGIEALGPLFPIGGLLLALWFTVAGLTAVLRGSARRRPAIPSR
jgi:hypothetical protein